MILFLEMVSIVFGLMVLLLQKVLLLIMLVLMLEMVLLLQALVSLVSLLLVSKPITMKFQLCLLLIYALPVAISPCKGKLAQLPLIILMVKCSLLLLLRVN